MSDGRGGMITHKAELDYLDDGSQKPIRIWSGIGRSPIVAVGNSNGDLEMLQFAGAPGTAGATPARPSRRPRVRLRLQKAVPSRHSRRLLRTAAQS